MRISVRPLRDSHLEVEVEARDLVEDLKATIAATKPNLPAEQQKLVHAGKVLSDGSTLDACGLKDGDFVVVMLGKPKAAADAAAPSEAVVSATAATGDSGAASTAPPPEGVDATPQAAAPVAPPPEATVQLLCDMGFPRPEVEACLRAAFNSPDRAVEYLTNGIPAAAAPGAPATQPSAPPAAHPAAGPAAPFGAAAAGSQAPRFPALPPATGPLAGLRNHPRFLQLKMAVQQNPQALNQVLSAIAVQDPSLIALVTEHQEEFVAMLQDDPNDPVTAMLAAFQASQSSHPQAASSGSGGGGGGTQGPVPAAAPPTATAPSTAAPAAAAPTGPALSAEQQQAVRRLQDLGFDHQRALQAYLACDRKEEVAANYLFEQTDE